MTGSSSSKQLGTMIAKLGVLFSLLMGCAKEPPRPTGPGTSVGLRYPVLLANDRQLLMKENLNSLTTASVASGPNYEAFIVLDSDGTQYTIQRVTEFGKKSVFLDMGTSQFQVFLALKAKGKLSLEQAKSLVKELAFSRGEVQNTVTAARLIDAAQSFPELMAVSQRPWEWR